MDDYPRKNHGLKAPNRVRWISSRTNASCFTRCASAGMSRAGVRKLLGGGATGGQDMLRYLKMIFNYSNPLNHADKVNSITILVSESSVLSFCELQVFFTLGVWTFVTFDDNFTSYLSGINVPSHLKEI